MSTERGDEAIPKEIATLSAAGGSLAMTTKCETRVYIGVTGNLVKRVWEHKNSYVKGFTSKYKVHKLVYFEVYQTAYDAITREKQLKGGSRKKKLVLISSMNPTWKDLYQELI